MLHLCVLVAYAKNSTRHELLGGSFAPAALLTLAFGMHAMWFVQCVKGNIRRWRKRSAVRITVNSGTEVSATLEEVKVQARNEGDDRTTVHVLDPSNLEVIIEPTRVTVDSEQEHSPVGALSTSLPELYHPQTDEESNSSSEEDEIRMSRSEFALRTPPIPVSYPTSKGVSLDSELKYRGSFSGAGTTLTSSSSSMLFIPGTYPASPSTGASDRPVLQRLNSVERAMQTLAALRASARTIRTQAQMLRAHAQAQTLFRARQRVRGVYDRLPDRRALYDYVGLNALSSPGGAREVRAY